MNSNEFQARAEAQHECILRWMRATGLTVSEWCQMGYAESFAKAWDLRLRGDVLYTVTVSTASRVNSVLGQ